MKINEKNADYSNYSIFLYRLEKLKMATRQKDFNNCLAWFDCYADGFDTFNFSLDFKKFTNQTEREIFEFHLKNYGKNEFEIKVWKREHEIEANDKEIIIDLSLIDIEYYKKDYQQ